MEKRLHVGIILDGNRRWAKARGMVPWKGHKAGAETLKKLVKELEDLNVRAVTLYTFSMQNFNRSDEEKTKLFDILKKYFDELRDDPVIVEKQIRINVIGRMELLPEDVQAPLGYMINKTKNYEGYSINFALAYGGREEIVDAVKKIVEKGIMPEDITNEIIEENLYMSDQPDFIIRTSGEQRTSNFLPWQSVYSEWFFLEKAWPDFTKQDLVECIDKFNNRNRRFGK